MAGAKSTRKAREFVVFCAGSERGRSDGPAATSGKPPEKKRAWELPSSEELLRRLALLLLLFWDAVELVDELDTGRSTGAVAPLRRSSSLLDRGKGGEFGGSGGVSSSPREDRRWCWSLLEARSSSSSSAAASRTNEASARFAPGTSASRRKAWSASRCAAVGLAAGFFWTHVLTKARNSGEKSPSNVGAGALGTTNKTRIGCRFE
mmetsp:Transcript_13159/g.39791  ORF Transcript_13159/g.39791 Transcript_13159/m.39791 type:complete len:206 (-) Transcript_13159:654-1271(-)